jgi:hypothetical protein
MVDSAQAVAATVVRTSIVRAFMISLFIFVRSILFGPFCSVFWAAAAVTEGKHIEQLAVAELLPWQIRAYALRTAQE